ncbi:MAG: DUF5681 domain-containing protein [Roseiarcus sp.]|jgi:hypothetical protein
MSSFDDEDAPQPAAGAASPHAVGDKHPPKHSQFKPGVSGNPRGRRRGSTSFRDGLAKEFGERVKIQENGRTKVVSKKEAMIKRFVAKALAGDERVFARLLPFIVALEGAGEANDAANALSDAERKMLKRNARRLLAEIADEEDEQ